MDEQSQHVRILYGPTTSGKSARALEMAAGEHAVIINADAMQCYDALPLLTAQPSRAEQAAVPHRLYGVIPAAQDILVTDWCKLALAEIEAARSAGLAPLVVGGTGFYIKALMEGLSPIPMVPDVVRATGERKLADEGLAALLRDLDDANPDDAQQLDRANPRRVLRAWEVLTATGRTFQSWNAAPRVAPPSYLRFELIPVLRPRAEIMQRIDDRFDQMIALGVLDEVRALAARVDQGDVPQDALILKAHGYRPLRAYLDGAMSLDEGITRSKAETRQYAKRQMTWLRGQFGVT